MSQVATLLEGDMVSPTRLFQTLGELEATGPVPLYNDLGAQFARLEEALQAIPNGALPHHIRHGATWARRTPPSWRRR